MREIKFRAYDTEHHYMTYNPRTEINFAGQIHLHRGWEYPETTCYILMQFTGLHDKNGKEIYEGDIVKKEYGVGYTSERYPSFVDGTQKSFLLPVEWERYGFLTLMMPRDPNFQCEFEVIGNIYEDKDLLEDK